MNYLLWILTLFNTTICIYYWDILNKITLVFKKHSGLISDIMKLIKKAAAL